MVLYFYLIVWKTSVTAVNACTIWLSFLPMLACFLSQLLAKGKWYIILLICFQNNELNASLSWGVGATAAGICILCQPGTYQTGSGIQAVLVLAKIAMT